VKRAFAILAFFIGTAGFIPKALGQAADGQEKLLVLPLFGYSDEQGLGVGANAAWLNIDGSPWNFSADLFASALYQQTYLNVQIYNRKLFDVLFLQAGGFVNRSTRGLFYGLGNSSSITDMSQFGIVDHFLYGRVGLNISPGFAAGVGYSHRSTSIERGSDPLIQQFQDRFSTNPRLSGTTTTATHFFVSYDTRPNILAPQEGELIFASLEQAQPRSGEDLAQQRFFLTAQKYWAISEKDLIVVTRGQYDHQWGEDVPFFLQSRLGGQSTLRAFKNNRFIDAASVLFNIEPRWTFWAPAGTVFERFELSVGVDTGRVFNHENFPPFDSYHTGWDLGLTGLLAGGVPLRLDYATGPEGALIYLHLFHPF
jgi:outer membrane protein assembly factor BamA